MSGIHGGEAAFDADLGDANSILLLVPTMDPADDDGCTRLLQRTPIDETDVLSVTLTDSPDDRMAAWRAHLDDEPANVGFVGVGDPARSAAAAGNTVDVPGRPILVENVSSPGDLTGLGMKITAILSDREGNGNATALCFHSLTALLQYVDLQRAFRFLHVLTGRIDTIDGTGHFHMDPTAHDDREINTLKNLFDAVVELEDGEWVVRSR